MMSMFKYFVALSWGLLAAAGAIGHSIPEDWVVQKPWVRVAPPGSKMLAGYATIGNPSDKPLTIESISSPDFAAASMHETFDEGGVSKMRKLDRVEIRANGSATFSPGGKHFMLMQPRRELKSGDWIKIHFDTNPGPGFEVDFLVCDTEPTTPVCDK